MPRAAGHLPAAADGCKTVIRRFVVHGRPEIAGRVSSPLIGCSLLTRLTFLPERNGDASGSANVARRSSCRIAA